MKDAPVGSLRWQLELLGMTVLGGLLGAAALVLAAPWVALETWKERRP